MREEAWGGRILEETHNSLKLLGVVLLVQSLLHPRHYPPPPTQPPPPHKLYLAVYRPPVVRSEHVRTFFQSQDTLNLKVRSIWVNHKLVSVWKQCLWTTGTFISVTESHGMPSILGRYLALADNGETSVTSVFYLGSSPPQFGCSVLNGRG